MKILKPILPVFIMGLSFSVNAQAENKTNGTYLSEKDFISHNITYPAGKGEKDNLFGYHDKGHDFRIFKQSSYQILDTTGFVLYSGYKLTQGTKGYTPVKKYFFSVKGSTDILPLTKDNLSIAFAKLPAFRYALEGYFQNDQELMAYDQIEKQYKLKHIYFNSIKQTLTPMQANR